MRNAIIPKDHENFDQDFIDILADRGHSIESLASSTSRKAAKTFVDLSMQLDYLITEDDFYLTNLPKLLSLLAEKKGFYDFIKEEVRNLDYGLVPKRAKLILYSQ